MFKTIKMVTIMKNDGNKEKYSSYSNNNNNDTSENKNSHNSDPHSISINSIYNSNGISNTSCLAPCMLVILHTCNIRQTNANKLKTSKVLFIFMHVLTAKGYGTLFSHIFVCLFTPSSFCKALSILPLAFEK